MSSSNGHAAVIDVPKPLDEQQVRFFVENGYLVVPNMMADEEIEELRADTVAIARGKYQCEQLLPLPAEVSDRAVLERILCIHQPHYISPVHGEVRAPPEICGVLSQITAAHLPFWDGSVKCMQSMLFVKPPNFQGQAWHQDEIYIPTRDRSLIGAWIALDDATVENGCLYVVPGSHRAGYLYPQHPHDNPDEFDFAPESYGFDESQQVPVEVKAGTVVFFNGYLLHRSFKNRGNGLPARAGEPLHERLVAAAVEPEGRREPRPTPMIAPWCPSREWIPTPGKASSPRRTRCF